MPIRLKNFRTKYPQYNDISDPDIVTMLANKFPDAYGDLPEAYTSRAKPEVPSPSTGAALDGPQPSFGGRAMETMRNIGKVYPMIDAGLQAVSGGAAGTIGGLTGLATLATGQGLEKAGANLDKVQKFLTHQPMTGGGQQLSETAAYPFTKLSEAGGAIADPIAAAGFPNVAAGVKTAIEAAPMLVGAKGVKPAVAKIKSTASKLQEAATQKSLKNLPFKAKKVVIKAINQAIKPSAAKQKTASAVKTYDNKALTAVTEIVKNKKNLGLLDEAGTKAVRLPKSIEDFQTAIAQTKGKIFKEYDTLAKASDKFRTERPQVYPINKYPKKDYGKPVGVDLSPAIKALDEITNDKTLRTFSPETIKYAYDRKESLFDRGIQKGPRQKLAGELPGFTAVEAQKSIQLLNKSLDAFYKDPSIPTYGKSMVDAVIANNLRKALDNTISKTTGKEYSAIKKKYGALKAIENDVSKAANRVRNRDTGKLLPEFTDVIAGHQVIGGLISLNLPKVASGLGLEAFNLIRKRMKDPDRKIKKMFKTVEENLLKQQARR